MSIHRTPEGLRGLQKDTYESGTQDDESSLAGAAIGCIHNPLASLLVEIGSHNDCVERTVFLDVHDLVDMVKIPSDFLVVWVVRRPVP